MAAAMTPVRVPGMHASVLDDLRRLPRLALWILAARMRTLGLSLVPVLAGTWIAAQAGAWRPDVALSAASAAAAIQIGTNLWNDAADAARGTDGPDRLGPPRMTGLGLLPARHVRIAAGAAFGLATVLGLHLALVGGWPIVVIGLASLAMGYLYSMGPYPLSGSPLGELLVIVFFGIVAVAGTAALQLAPVDARVLLLGVTIGLPAAAVLLVNNHRDRSADARAGRRTLAILIGIPASRLLYAGLLLASLYGAWRMAPGCALRAVAFLPPAALSAVLIRDMAILPISSGLNRLIARTSLFQGLLLLALVLSDPLCQAGAAIP